MCNCKIAIYTDILQIICHELGHNLGMTHDFTDPFTSPKTILRDSKGISCTDANGVMDYYVTVQKWSTCSVEAFTQHYNNVVNSDGKFCMAVAGDGATAGKIFCISMEINVMINIHSLKVETFGDYLYTMEL